MIKTSFNETKALELYHSHKTDTEIAKGVNALTITIKGWRNRRGLANISPGARKHTNHVSSSGGGSPGAGVDYRMALDPVRAKDMNQFLRSLLWASDKAKECGVHPNVDIFMRCWIGLPISEDGKKRQRRDNARSRRSAGISEVRGL